MNLHGASTSNKSARTRPAKDFFPPGLSGRLAILLRGMSQNLFSPSNLFRRDAAEEIRKKGLF
jgi:hypothetical protein